MTIKYLSGNRIQGLSTDTKPTNIVEGSRFLETDTRNEYQFDDKWTYKPQLGFGSQSKAMARQGMKQHFVDWCTGKGYQSSYWKFTQINGSSTLYDTITGSGKGLAITNDSGSEEGMFTVGNGGTNTPSAGTNLRHYGGNCGFVAVLQNTGTLNATIVRGGMKTTENGTFTSDPHFAGQIGKAGASAPCIFRAAKSSWTEIYTDVASNNNPHVFKGEFMAGDHEGTGVLWGNVDGIMGATISACADTQSRNYLPDYDDPLLPFFYYYGTGTGVLSYYEAWNG